MIISGGRAGLLPIDCERQSNRARLESWIVQISDVDDAGCCWVAMTGNACRPNHERMMCEALAYQCLNGEKPADDIEDTKRAQRASRSSMTQMGCSQGKID